MLFSIIYSADCTSDQDIADYAPPDLNLFDQTEGDDCYNYGYLEGAWEHGHHAKWTGLLTKEQFEAFVSHCGLVAEDIETMDRDWETD